MTTKIPAELSSTPGIADSSNATAITINSSENVTVANNFFIEPVDSGKLYFTSSSGFSPRIESVSTALTLRTNNSERMRIANDGKIGIGTTSPSGTLDVHSSSVGIAIEHSGSGAFNHVGEFFCPNLTNTENALLAIGKSGNTKQAGYLGYYWTADNSDNNFFHMSHWASDYLFRVYGQGNYYFAGSSVSDRDLKENIVDIPEPSLDKVKQLRVRKFNMIPLGDDDVTPTKVGFIAQEVQEAMPNVVTGTDGNKDMAVDTTGIVGHLVKAIQEQQEIIEDLKSRIETLEG